MRADPLLLLLQTTPGKEAFPAKGALSEPAPAEGGPFFARLLKGLKGVEDFGQGESFLGNLAAGATPLTKSELKLLRELLTLLEKLAQAPTPSKHLDQLLALLTKPEGGELLGKLPLSVQDQSKLQELLQELVLQLKQEEVKKEGGKEENPFPTVVPTPSPDSPQPFHQATLSINPTDTPLPKLRPSEAETIPTPLVGTEAAENIEEVQTPLKSAENAQTISQLFPQASSKKSLAAPSKASQEEPKVVPEAAVPPTVKTSPHRSQPSPIPAEIAVLLQNTASPKADPESPPNPLTELESGVGSLAESSPTPSSPLPLHLLSLKAVPQKTVEASQPLSVSQASLLSLLQRAKENGNLSPSPSFQVSTFQEEIVPSLFFAPHERSSPALPSRIQPLSRQIASLLEKGAVPLVRQNASPQFTLPALSLAKGSSGEDSEAKETPVKSGGKGTLPLMIAPSEAKDLPTPKTAEAKALSLPSPQEVQEAMGQILKSVLFLKTSQGDEARLRLHPPQLGEVHVRVSADKGVVDLSFRAESVQIKQLLEEQAPQLVHALQSHGLQLGSLSVNINTPNSGHPMVAQDHFATPLPSETEGTLEELPEEVSLSAARPASRSALDLLA